LKAKENEKDCKSTTLMPTPKAETLEWHRLNQKTNAFSTLSQISLEIDKQTTQQMWCLLK